MSKGLEHIRESREALIDAHGTRPLGTAYLTNGATPPVLIVPGSEVERRAYYHTRIGADRRPGGTAILDATFRYENKAEFSEIVCKIGKKAGDERLWILPQDNFESTGGSTVQEQATNAAAFTPSAQITTLRINPTNPASMNVQIDAANFAYINPSTGALRYLNNPILNVSASVPGATLHRLGLVYLDPIAETVSIINGSTAVAAGALPSRSEFVKSDYEAFTVTGLILVGYIYFYYGQTTVVDADCRHNFNPRLLFSYVGSPHMRLSTRVVTAAGAVTVLTSDYVVVVNKGTGAATVVNLPASPTAGDSYIIHDGKGDAATNNITVTPAGGALIDGAATVVMNVNYQTVRLVYNGTQYNVI